MSIYKFLFAGLCLTSFITSVSAADDISELILSNGLKVIVKPDHRSPITVFQIWYKVGSANEQKGYTGISHLLEHMMYRGGKTPYLEHVYKKMSLIGTKGNAYTSRDYTYYYHTLGSEHIELAFSIEADRMKHLNIDKNELAIEKKVIQEEWHTSLIKDPYLRANNALYNFAFQHEPYQMPVIGRMEDQVNLSPSLILNWHNNYYTPDNATLVIVGDINNSEIFSLARQYFSSIKTKKKLSETNFSSRSHQIDTNKENITHIVMPEKTKVAMILMAFKVPSIKTSSPKWEAYALDVLAGWFDSGFHSRLTHALINVKQVAQDVFVRYSPMNKTQSLFIIEATPAHNISIQQLEQAILEELQQIKSEMISAKELLKVKTQMTATGIFERDSMLTQAQIIGQAESVDINWLEDTKYISHIKSVTAQQIKSVFQRYIDLNKKFVVIQNSHKDEKSR